MMVRYDGVCPHKSSREFDILLFHGRYIGKDISEQEEEKLGDLLYG